MGCHGNLNCSSPCFGSHIMGMGAVVCGQPWECSVPLSVKPVREISTNHVLWVLVCLIKSSCHRLLWQSQSTVWQSDNQRQTDLCQALSEPEEIVLCTVSTHWDLQLLPYIWAFTLGIQLYLWVVWYIFICISQMQIQLHLLVIICNSLFRLCTRAYLASYSFYRHTSLQ